jgi:hypothetical protein
VGEDLGAMNVPCRSQSRHRDEIRHRIQDC